MSNLTFVRALTAFTPPLLPVRNPYASLVRTALSFADPGKQN
jgi:hypothetical protein